MVIRSPCAVGTVATRMSTSLPAIFRRIRPSWGRRFSAMLRPAMILTRATMLGWWALGARFTSCNTPSTRLRMITSLSPGSTWMSLARSFEALKIRLLTKRMIGASSAEAWRMSSSSSARSSSFFSRSTSFARLAYALLISSWTAVRGIKVSRSSAP